MKLLRILFTFIIFFSLTGSSFAQPAWQSGTPTVTPHTQKLQLDIDLDRNSNVYIVVFPYHLGSAFPANTVKTWAQAALPSGDIVENEVYSYTTPGVTQTLFYEGLAITQFIQANHNYCIILVAEDAAVPGSYSVVNYYDVNTTPCPSIFVETGLVNADRCVNGDGATKIYTFNTKDGHSGVYSNALKGAEWTIDWGEGGGPVLFHTSTYDNDGPGGILVPGWEYGDISHTYFVHDICYYVANLTITNPRECATVGTQSETKIPIVHGRDLDIDGDGEFIVDEFGTGVTDTIYVCEGYEYITSTEDISTWDCQPDIYYPGDLPGSPTGEPNTDFRTLQWTYGGASADATFEANANTISGNVVITGVGTAITGGAGVMGDTIETDTPTLNQSALITIPATAQEGEQFKIYYKNWNKCNPFIGAHYDNSNYIETEIVILIIHAPDPPIAPDRDFCEGSVGNLTAAPREGGILTWYDDAGLTNVVGTGGTFNHGQTAPGIYTYYVTETFGGCEGAPETVTLTIVANIGNNIIDNPQSHCVGDPATQIWGATPTGGTGAFIYQWQSSTTGAGAGFSDIPGAVTKNYTPGVLPQTTWFRRTVISSACTSTSNSIEITIVAAPLGNPVPAGTFFSCTGITLDITPIANQPGTTFSWSGDNGSSGTGNIDDTPVNPGPGDLDVTYTVTPTGPAPTLCPGNPFDIVVTIQAMPTIATVGADDIVCATTYPNLGGNNPATGTGQWSVVSDIIWKEDFDDLAVGTTVDAGGTAWTRDVHGINLPGRPGYFEVRDASGGGKWFELNNSGDPYVDWISEPIDISGRVGTVELSIKLQEPFTNTLENGDWIEGWYSVDGGAEQVFFARITNDYTGPIWRTLGGITGDLLTIRINARTGATNEFQTFDDVTVRDQGIAVLAIVDNPALNNSSASSLQPDENTFRWTISNGFCPITFADITISRDVQPSAADAGSNQAFCDLTSTNLNAVPVDNGGTGTWTRLTGPSSITSPNDPTSEVTGLGYGTNNFQWEATSKYGVCPATQDNVTITRDNPVAATVGADQDFCSGLPLTSNPLGGSNPAPGSGLWSMVSGPGSVSAWTPNATTANATATVTSYGLYQLQWEITNGTCVTSDIIEVDFGQAPSPSVPGPDDATCGLVYTFGATAPVVGQGTWTLDIGPGTAGYNDENSETATVTVTAYGTYTFRWTVSSGACPTEENTVDITFSEPATSDAGVAFTVCRDGTTPAPIPVSGVIGGGATTGSWSVQVGSGSLSGSVVAFPNVTDSYTPDPSDVGGLVTLRLTADDPDGAGPCIAVTSDVIITINEAATADAGANYSVCRDGTAPADLNISGTIGGGATTGFWTVLVGNGSLAGSTVAGTTVSDVYTPDPADIGGTITLRLRATDPDGAGPCIDETDAILIAFSEAATSDAGADLTVCRTETAPAVVNISGTIGGAATTGSWTIVTGLGSLAGSSVVGTTVSDTYTPDPADVGNTVTLRLTAADPDGAFPCTDVPDEMDIIINMAAESDAGVDYIVCRDGTAPAIIPLSGTIGGGATTGTWSIVSGSGSIGASTTVGSTVTATYTPVAGDVGGTVEMRLTATDPDGAGPCGNIPDDVIITINESATSDAGVPYTVCRSSVTPANIPISGTIGGAATTGSWSIVIGNGSLAGSTVAGTAVNDIYTPDPTDVGGTITLELTTDDPDAAGPCTDVTSQVVLTINEASESDAGIDYEVCRDETAPAVIDLTGTIGGAATTGNWSIVVGNGSIGPSTVIGNTVTATYTTDPADVSGTVTMRLTAADPDAGGPCTDVTDEVIISVNMEAEVDAGANYTVCRDGIAPANIDLSGTIGGGATSGTWSIVTGNGTIGGSTTVGNTVTASYTPDPTDVGGFIQIRLTATDPDGAGPCADVSDIVNITLNLAPTVDAGVDLAIAAGSPASLLGSFGGSTGLITWTGGVGIFDPNENSPTADYYPTLAEETAGSIELVMVSNDPDGAGPCTIVTDTMVIIIGENPTADAGPDFDICEIDSIPLIGVIGGSASTGTWSAIVGAGTIYDNVTGADDTVRAVYVTTPAERATDVATGYIRVQLKTDDPDGAGPVEPDSSRKDITIRPLPVTPAIAGPTEACVNTVNMVYISNPLRPNSYYEWNVPASLGIVTSGGSGYNNNAVIMNAAAVGAADTIWLLERTQFGCVGDTMKLGLQIYDYPAQSAITGPGTVCANDTAVTYSVPLNPGSTYQWFRPPGAFVNPPDTANEVNIDFGFSSGVVSVWETNPAGCVTTHIPLPVTVSPLPTANLNASDVIICPGQPVTFTATPAGMANYDFFVDDTLAQTGIAATYLTDSLTDGQTVTVEVTNAGGCSDKSSGITVIVSTIPDISLVSSDADNIICFNESVTFTATSATGVSFEFFVDGLPVQNSPLTFFTTDTLHDGETVTVTTRDIVGCESTSPGITTTVNPLPVADLSGNAIICPTDVTNLTINITTGFAPFTVEVDNGILPIAGYGSNDPIPVSPLATTVYNLLNVTDANGCRVDAPHANLTGTATITLNADITVITQPTAVTDCEGSDVTFQVLVSGTAPTYQWRKGGANLADVGNISGATTDELSITNIQPADAAMYDVVVSGTCLPATSAAVALTVDENITITGNPVDVIECPGGTIQFGAAATGTNPVYRWRKNGTPLLDGGTISGTGTDTMTISGINILDAGSYDVIVTGACVPDTSTAATLTLNIQPNIIDQPDPVIECEGGLITFTVDAGTTTNPTYEWQVDSLLGPGFGAVSGGPYSGENTPTLIINPIDSDMNGFQFRVLVGGECTPSVLSAEVGLTVLEIPEITEHPSDSIICEDASVTFRVNPGVTTIPVYTWEVDDGGGWNTITGAPYFGYNSAQLGILSAPSTMNGYQYRVTISGTCAPAMPSNVATLTVNQKPEVSAHPADAVECENGLVTFTVAPGLTTNPAYQWQVDQGVGFTDISGGVYTGENTATLTADPIISAMGGYRYRALISGTCTPQAVSNPASLTVDENPEIIVQPTDETICELDDIFFFVNPGLTTDPTFVWEYNTGAGWNPVPADAVHSDINNDTLFLTAAPSTMHNWQYRVVVDGKCNVPITSDEITLTVNQRPEIILHPIDSTICENADATFTVDAGLTTGATYQWQVSMGGAFGNIFGGIYSGENTPVLTVSGAPSSYDGFLYRVLVGGVCTPDIISDTAVFTVLEKPEILSQPIDVTICEDDNALFGINSGVTTNPIYQWQVDDGLGGGFVDILAGPIYSGFNSDTLRITGGLAAMDSYEYRVVVYGDCTPNDTSDAVTLTVFEKPEILSQPSDSTICENDNATFGVYAGVTTTPFYQWQVDDGMGGGFVNAFGPFYVGQNTDTLMVVNAPSSMNGYMFRVVISGACNPADTSAVVTLTVNDRPEILVQPTAPVICEDGMTLIGIDAGATTGASFQWQVDDHLGGGFTDISGAPYTGFNTDTLIINPAISTMHGYTYQVILTGACPPILPSNAVDLTVNEKPEVIVHPVDSTVCEGAQAAFTVDAGVTTMAAYEWLVDEGTGFNPISGGPYFGENTANLLLTTTDSSMNGFQYRVVVSGICTPNDTSNAATLTILERPEIASHPVDTTECEDGSVTFGVDPGKTTAPNYQWQVDEGMGFGDIAGGDYAGFTSDTLTALNINTTMHGFRYRVIVSGTCTPDATSSFASLFINEKPEISKDPDDMTVCELDGASFDVGPGVTTDPEYRWEYDQGTGTWIDVPAGPIYEGVDSNILVINTTDPSMNGFMYHAVISGVCAPPATSGDATLTVHERPEITLQPIDETICEDDNITFNVNAGLTTSPTYQWQVSFGAGFNNVGGAVYTGGTTPALSLSNVPSSMNGYQYRAIIGGSCTPQIISDTVVLTVLEKPEVLLHPDDADECEDGTVIFTVNPGVTTLPTFQWQESTGGLFTDLAEVAPYSGVNTDTLIISGIISPMHTNRYRVVVSGTCVPDATSNDASLTVYEKPEIIIEPTDETICEDGNTSFTVDAGVTTNPIYQWQVDQNSGTFVNVSGGFYSGQNSATLNITGALSYMNGYIYRVIVAGYCAPADTSLEVTLTILEKPEVILQPANALICEGLETYFRVDAGGTTLPIYEWQVDDGSGSFVAVSGAPYVDEDTDSLIITMPTSAMNGYIYRVRISGSCAPDAFSNSAMLMVQENPEVILHPSDSIICENENAMFTVDAGVTTSPDYQWQVDDGGGWVNLTDAGKYVGSRTAFLNIFNGTADMDGYRYHVIVSGECAPPVTSNPATLTVNLRPVINTHPVNSTICELGVTSFSVVATGFGLTYEWQVDDGGGYAPVIDGGVYSGAGTPTLTVSGPDATYDGFRYRVMVDNYCGPIQSSNIVTLTVNTSPAVVVNPVDVQICEFTNTTFQVTAQGGGLTYQWEENDGGGWSDILEAGNYVGTTTPSLSLFTVDSIMTGYQYRVRLSGLCAPDAYSVPVTLTVYTSPQITVHPVNMAVCETVDAQFTVTAIGDGLIYRWQENNGGGFADIPEGGFYSGTNTATLNLNAPIVGMNGNTYRVIVSGTCVPPVTSNFAMLTVNTFPSMITQPVSDEICEDGNVTFIAAASGTGISYQWQENSGAGWTDIIDGGIYSGATTPTFTLTNIPLTYNGYQYRLNVVGTCAPMPSDVADLIVNANPVASISGDGNFPVVCGGIPMILNGNPSGGSGTWTDHAWGGDLFPINPIDEQVTVFQTAAHGSYNLTYTVTDSKGCMAIDQVIIENDRPDARFTSNARPSCGTLTVDYTNQSNRAVVYEWNFDDPLNPGVVSDENPTYDFSNFNTSVQYFNVELVAFSINGCTDTAKEVVTIYPSIDASFTTDPSEGCNPLTVEMVSTPGGSNYYWDFDDGNAKNGEHHEIHQFVNLGTDPVTYNVSLTTTSFYGCFDTKIMPVTVYPIPQVNFTADPIIQEFPSATVDFNNLTPEGSWGFTWDFDDGNFSNEVNPSHTYGAPGDYTVTLTASTTQCVDSIVHLISIRPAAPIADFVQPEPGCAPLEITFQNNSQYATSYVWDFGNGSTSFKENPTFTYYESGTYAVSLTVFGPGGTDNITHLVEVKITPNAYTTVAPTYVFVNDVPVKCFNLTTDTSNCTYLWDFGDGETSNIFEPAHVYKEPGRYDITLTATNDNECSSTYVFSYIEVEPAGELLFPNVFKPNPDGPSDGRYVQGQDNNQIFFPGVYDQVIQYELVIYNRWGELIFLSNDVNIGWDGYIDGKMMAQQGVYVWKVTGKYANGKGFVHVGDITLLR